MTGWNPQPPPSTPHYQPPGLSRGQRFQAKFGPLPPEARWPRIAGFLLFGYGILGIIAAILAALIGIVMALDAGSSHSSAYGPTRSSSDSDVLGFLILVVIAVVVVILFLLPLLISGHRLARFPTKANSIFATVIAGVPTLYGILFFASVMNPLILLLPLFFGVPIVLIWAKAPARRYVLSTSRKGTLPQAPAGQYFTGPPAPMPSAGQPSGVPPQAGFPQSGFPQQVPGGGLPQQYGFAQQGDYPQQTPGAFSTGPNNAGSNNPATWPPPQQPPPVENQG